MSLSLCWNIMARSSRARGFLFESIFVVVNTRLSLCTTLITIGCHFGTKKPLYTSYFNYKYIIRNNDLIWSVIRLHQSWFVMIPITINACNVNESNHTTIVKKPCWALINMNLINPNFVSLNEVIYSASEMESTMVIYLELF